MRILADTGILLRYTDPTDPRYAAVRAAVGSVAAAGDLSQTGFQNHTEFWNVCTRPKTARGGLGLSIAETDRRLSIVEATCPLLVEPAAVRALWRSLVIAHAVRGKQVHDARLVALMTASGITHILTLNPGDFARYPGVVEIVP